MPLFTWKCTRCGDQYRQILPSRPKLPTCSASVLVPSGYTNAGPVHIDGPCGGELEFITNTSSQTMEVIDNGLMAKVLERPANVAEKMADRAALAEKPDDPIV